jgi:hypothetical protein
VETTPSDATVVSLPTREPTMFSRDGAKWVRWSQGRSQDPRRGGGGGFGPLLN